MGASIGELMEWFANVVLRQPCLPAASQNQKHFINKFCGKLMDQNFEFDTFVILFPIQQLWNESDGQLVDGIKTHKDILDIKFQYVRFS